MAAAHALVDCAQGPILAHIMATLEHMDTRGERTAVALEQIAAQGAMMAGHEKRLDKHDEAFTVVFNRINDQARLERVEQKLVELEKKIAKEDGAEEVIYVARAERRKFWTDVKLKMIGPCLTFLFFALWLCDKMNLFTKARALWCQFTGGL